MKALLQTDIDAVMALVPEPVQAILRVHPVVLAGGAIRDIVSGGEIKDLDIFCRNPVQAEVLALKLSLAFDGPAHRVKKTLYSHSVEVLGLPVQFVFYRDYANPAGLIEQFDFRACCAGIYWSRNLSRWVGIASDGFYEDCEAKVLTFLAQDKDRDSLIPLRRALKLSAKGWKLPDEGVAGILQLWDSTIQPDKVHRSLGPGYGGRR